MNNLRLLVWLYLLLLLFEGALRKWIVPSLDTPLLIVRDPVVILIYFLAYQNGLSFKNSFHVPNLALALLTGAVALIFSEGNLYTTLFGLRANYLQIPLIFLLPQILDRAEIIKIGYFILGLSIFMAALVVMQFKAPPDSSLNIGAMETHYGTVRPSATFSFMTGTVAFFALVASFLFYGFIQLRTYKIWLLALVTISVLVACACSGSRSCLVSVALVAAAAIIGVAIYGRSRGGIIIAAAIIIIAFGILQSTSIFQEGSGQLAQRIDDAGASEGGTEGFVGRFIGTLAEPFKIMDQTPLFGHGLGVGTNAGAGMLRGERVFIGPEDEWGRLVFECGPLFGLLLILFRVALTGSLAVQVFRALRENNILPLLFFASSGLLVLNGQWGVPTIQGFAIFGAGLTLAACKEEDEEEIFDDDSEFETVPDKIKSQLH